ncbi:MAG: glycine cleavage T C-terminal barrel domain-containing protein, partial [Boseongicola sp.]
YENGSHVGFTTSGAVGPRTGLNLAFGLVTVEPGETLDETCSRRFLARVAGRDYVAAPLRRPPYDPDEKRMRG